MTVIKKNYLSIGGHKWAEGVGDLPSSGGTGLFCSVCGIGAMINGGHRKCIVSQIKPLTPSLKGGNSGRVKCIY